jgi:hypothetical protein
MNRQMRTAELRFFMMPDEARDRIRQALPTSGDALYAYPEPRRIVELASANDVEAHLDQEWQFFAGAPGLRELSPTAVQPGQLVLLYLPDVDGDALVMADIGVTWDPEHPDAEAQYERFKRWRAVFRKGLRGSTRWRPDDRGTEERPVNELFSEGALAFYREGGRWKQRGVPHQEWHPSAEARPRNPG